MELIKTLNTIGVTPPSDFPSDQYNAIHFILRELRENDPKSWTEWAGAWNSIAYRYMAFAEHDEKFTESITRFGTSSNHNERYIQEKELFEFFICGLSTLESFHYGLYAINSIFRPKEFNLIHDNKLKKITPVKVKETIASTFPKESISNALIQLHIDNSFIELNNLRNILIHRAHHGRNLFMGGKDDGKAQWINGIAVDNNTTKSRQIWLSKVITELMKNTYQLTSSLVAVYNKNL